MFTYIVRRLMIMIPTFFGITLVFFMIINMAPGSPIEQKIQQLKFGGAGDVGSAGMAGESRDSAVNSEVIEALKKQYGFDKPVHVRYWIWLKNIFRLDFGESFTYEEPVIDVIASKLPVSLQFGVISLILSYLVCIPLGIYKARHHRSTIDLISSVIIFIMYSVPPFMLAVVLIVYFSGGLYFDWFPIGYLVSDEYDDFTLWGKIVDRVHHFVLPLVCYMIGQFTVLTMLMKNSILDVIKQDYIRTARAKGLPERIVYMKHALRNALIPIVTGLGGFLSIFFAGSILLELIFQLDGIGLMSYQAVLERDYNILMGSLFFQSLAMLLGNLISDIAYILVDPRIDFS